MISGPVLSISNKIFAVIYNGNAENKLVKLWGNVARKISLRMWDKVIF